MKTQKKLAIICAWRAGETELASTLESAKASAGRGALILPVEDVARQGPARTRHRGIEAAAGADVVILIDAHMRMDLDILARLGKHVREHGGLLCPLVWHNAECTFDAKHPSGASHYAGADIHYTGRDQNGRQSLCWHWASDPTPGPRPCVGGACYAFRRDWYYDVGQPLSALPAWGADEESLSVSAFLSGHMPQVFDGRVAHRWRPKPPWPSADRQAMLSSRAALISAVVADPDDRRELLAWQACSERKTPEVARWREALLRQPRTWTEWRNEVPTMGTPDTAAPTTTAPAACVRFQCQDCPADLRLPEGMDAKRCPLCGREQHIFRMA